MLPNNRIIDSKVYEKLLREFMIAEGAPIEAANSIEYDTARTSDLEVTIGDARAMAHALVVVLRDKGLLTTSRKILM